MIELQELGYKPGDQISHTNWYNGKTEGKIALIELRRSDSSDLVALGILAVNNDEVKKLVIQKIPDGRWKDQFGEFYKSPMELITMEFRGYQQVTEEI